MNKIFQEHSLDSPVFRLVASLKSLHFRKVFCIYEQNLWNTPLKEYMDFHTAHMLWQEFIFGCEQIDPTGYH